MENITPVIYLFLALGCLIGSVGIIIWLVGYFRGRDQEETVQRDQETPPAPEPEPEEVRLAPSRPGASAPAPPVPSKQTVQTNEQELLRVIRTEAGQAIVMVHGKRYQRLKDIRDGRAERDAAEGLHALLTFAEGWLPALKQASPLPPPKESDADAREAFLAMLRQADAFSSGQHGRLSPLLSGSSSVISNMDQSIQGVITSHPGKSLVAPAEQINNLVQRRLQDRPDLRKHGIISVTTSKEGDLQFHVGLQTFAVVEDITAPQVRALIQDAIREWSED